MFVLLFLIATYENNNVYDFDFSPENDVISSLTLPPSGTGVIRFSDNVQFKPLYPKPSDVKFYVDESKTNEISDDIFVLLVAGINSTVYVENTNSAGSEKVEFYNFVQDNYLEILTINSTHFEFATRPLIANKNNIDTSVIQRFVHFEPGQRIFMYGSFSEDVDVIFNCYMKTMDVSMYDETTLSGFNISLYNDLIPTRVNRHLQFFTGDRYLFLFKVKVQTSNINEFFYMYKLNTSHYNATVNTGLNCTDILGSSDIAYVNGVNLSYIYLPKSEYVSIYMYPFDINDELKQGEFHMVTGPFVIKTKDQSVEYFIYTLEHNNTLGIYEYDCQIGSTLSSYPGSTDTIIWFLNEDFSEYNLSILYTGFSDITSYSDKPNTMTLFHYNETRDEVGNATTSQPYGIFNIGKVMSVIVEYRVPSYDSSFDYTGVLVEALFDDSEEEALDILKSGGRTVEYVPENITKYFVEPQTMTLFHDFTDKSIVYIDESGNEVSLNKNTPGFALSVSTYVKVSLSKNYSENPKLYVSTMSTDLSKCVKTTVIFGKRPYFYASGSRTAVDRNVSLFNGSYECAWLVAYDKVGWTLEQNIGSDSLFVGINSDETYRNVPLSKVMFYYNELYSMTDMTAIFLVVKINQLNATGENYVKAYANYDTTSTEGIDYEEASYVIEDGIVSKSAIVPEEIPIEEKGLSGAEIGGIATGASVAVICGAAGVIYYVYRRNKRLRELQVMDMYDMM